MAIIKAGIKGSHQVQVLDCVSMETCNPEFFFLLPVFKPLKQGTYGYNKEHHEGHS